MVPPPRDGDRGSLLVLGAMVYVGLTINPGTPYFPNLVLPIIVGVLGLGLINVALGLPDLQRRRRPHRAHVSDLGHAAVPRRTARAGGNPGHHYYAHTASGRYHRAGESDEPAQLLALDDGYTYGRLWLEGWSSCSLRWR